METEGLLLRMWVWRDSNLEGCKKQQKKSVFGGNFTVDECSDVCSLSSFGAALLLTLSEMTDKFKKKKKRTQQKQNQSIEWSAISGQSRGKNTPSETCSDCRIFISLSFICFLFRRAQQEWNGCWVCVCRCIFPVYTRQYIKILLIFSLIKFTLYFL